MVKCSNKGCNNDCDKQLIGDPICFTCYVAWSKGDKSLQIGEDEDE